MDAPNRQQRCPSDLSNAEWQLSAADRMAPIGRKIRETIFLSATPCALAGWERSFLCVSHTPVLRSFRRPKSSVALRNCLCHRMLSKTAIRFSEVVLAGSGLSA